MRKSFSLILIVIIMMTLVVGCGGQKPAETPKPEAQPQPQTVTFRLGHVCQIEHPYQYACQFMADEIAKRTNGRVKIEIYPARQLGGDRDLLEMVMNGSLDMGAISSCIFGGFTPLIDAYQLPFLVSNYDILDKAFPGKASDELLKGLDSINVKAIGVYDAGLRYLVSRKPVNSLNEVKGAKIRVSEAPLILDIFKAAGMSPTPMPYGEIYSALQTGVIDAIEMDLSAIVAEKHFEVAKYIYETGHFTWPFVMVLSKKAWDSLSAEDKKVFEDVALETYAFNHKNVRELDENAIAFLNGKGIKVNKIGGLEDFIKAEQSVIDTYIAKDPRIKAFYDEVQALKNK